MFSEVIKKVSEI